MGKISSELGGEDEKQQSATDAQKCFASAMRGSRWEQALAEFRPKYARTWADVLVPNITLAGGFGRGEDQKADFALALAVRCHVLAAHRLADARPRYSKRIRPRWEAFS